MTQRFDAPRIRLATDGDRVAIWSIIEPIIKAGETYALDRDMSEIDALAYWLGPDRASFVAETRDGVRGTYYLKRNQAGGGSHIANCGYAVAETATGRGLARAMAEHSLVEARNRGFKGMQYNFVIETNTVAIALWERLGFETLARLPNAFEHPSEGRVDALLMWRDL